MHKEKKSGSGTSFVRRNILTSVWTSVPEVSLELKSEALDGKGNEEVIGVGLLPLDGCDVVSSSIGWAVVRATIAVEVSKSLKVSTMLAYKGDELVAPKCVSQRNSLDFCKVEKDDVIKLYSIPRPIFYMLLSSHQASR